MSLRRILTTVVELITPTVAAAQAFDSRSVVTNFWLSKDFSKPAAEGIADAVMGESGGDPLAVGDGGTSLGLYQHHADRLRTLLANIQNNQAFQELMKDDPIAAAHADEIRNAPDRERARVLFSKFFERPRQPAPRPSAAASTRRAVAREKPENNPTPPSRIQALLERYGASSDIFHISANGRVDDNYGTGAAGR